MVAEAKKIMSAAQNDADPLSTGPLYCELLRKGILKCPNCSQAWLIIGAAREHSHTCKSCGHHFRIPKQIHEQ